MDLLSNQTYKKKVVFHKNSDKKNKVAISISVQCNHQLPDNILTSIEGHLNSLFIHDYMTEELYLQHKELEKKEAEIIKQAERRQAKIEQEMKKRNEELRQREMVAKLEFEKAQLSKVKTEVDKIEAKEVKSKKKKKEVDNDDYIMPKL